MTRFQMVTVIGSILVTFLPLQSVAQSGGHDTHQERLQHNLAAAEGVNPGDTKYMHLQYHRTYQLLEAEMEGSLALGPGDTGFRSDLRGSYVTLYRGTKCSCDYGSCRPTIVRFSSVERNEDGSSGYEILLDGKWYSVPQKTLNHENDVTADLWELLMQGLPEGINGHACAFPSNGYKSGMNIECVLVPKLHG